MPEDFRIRSYEGRAIGFGPVADLSNSTDPHIQEFLAMDALV
jgi:hypothetical protein